MNQGVVTTLPEVELLLSCARSQINPENIACIKELCQKNIDWDYLLRMAGRHGLMPLLYQNLNSVCPQDVPEGIFNKLKNHFNANTGYNLFLTGELLKLLNLFEANEIPAVAYKGPVLASSIYRNLALREFVDLDILIHKRNIIKAKELLVTQGYQPLFRLTPLQEEAYLKSQCELHFMHEKSNINLEILWEFAPRDLSFPVNLDDLWERLGTISLAGRKLLNLSPEDSILILCVHGFKHYWARLVWLCDISELIRINYSLNWNSIMEEATRFSSERMLFLGLYLVNTLLGVSLPDNVLQGINADPMVKPLATKVQEHLFRDGDGSFGIFESHLFFLKSMERLQDRIRYCLHVAMSPTPLEYGLLTLPSSLFFLYYVIRPLRLLGKYSFSPLKAKN